MFSLTLFDLMFSVYQIAKFYFLLLLFVLKCKHILDEEYVIIVLHEHTIIQYHINK